MSKGDKVFLYIGLIIIGVLCVMSGMQLCENHHTKLPYEQDKLAFVMYAEQCQCGNSLGEVEYSIVSNKGFFNCSNCGSGYEFELDEDGNKIVKENINMEIRVRELTDKIEVLNAARKTVWKDGVNKEPSEKFMHNIYRSEHSPIRDRMFVIEIDELPYWVSTHFVRHSIGYTPYVSTSREDRITYNCSRDELPQGKLVNMRITLNAQAFINVSKVRLCNSASKETREVWKGVIDKLMESDKELAMNCVPSCVYRGFCPEGNHSTCFKGKAKWREEYVAYQLSK